MTIKNHILLPKIHNITNFKNIQQNYLKSNKIIINNFYYTYLNSPLLFFSTCNFFMWFSYKKIKYSKIINKLGSISFAVYLIHDHFTVRSYLWNDLLKVTTPSNINKSLITIIISIMLIYLFTLIIETIRNFIFDKLEKLLSKNLKKERRKERRKDRRKERRMVKRHTSSKPLTDRRWIAARNCSLSMCCPFRAESSKEGCRSV